MTRKSYTLRRADRAHSLNQLNAGDTVYDFMYHDYGCASGDTRYTGIEHTSVTLDPKGGYPFFTIPVMDLEPVRAEMPT